MTLRSVTIEHMETEQGSLFDKHSYRGTKTQTYSITPPTADTAVTATLPVSRKVSALGNYFRWLRAEGVLTRSPVRFQNSVTSPDLGF